TGDYHKRVSDQVSRIGGLLRVSGEPDTTGGRSRLRSDFVSYPQSEPRGEHFFSTSSTLVRVSPESTWPARVATPFVESTEKLVTLGIPMSGASFDFTCVAIFRSFTCPPGNSFVHHPRSDADKSTKKSAFIWTASGPEQPATGAPL